MTLEEHILSLHSPPVLDVLGRWVHLRNARTGTTSMDEGPLRGRCVMKSRNKHQWRIVWQRVIYPKMRVETVAPVLFTFVRNPWDRVCSAFFHCRDRVKAPENKIDKKWEFPDWVREVLAVHGPNINMHFAKQYPTAFFEGEQFGFVGRFENMQEDWSKLAHQIGVSPSLPHSNSTGRDSYVDYYEDDTIDIIGNMYSRDVEAFGYEFGK